MYLKHKRTKFCRIFTWVPKTKGTLKENANPRKDPTKKNQDSTVGFCGSGALRYDRSVKL